MAVVTPAAAATHASSAVVAPAAAAAHASSASATSFGYVGQWGCPDQNFGDQPFDVAVSSAEQAFVAHEDGTIVRSTLTGAPIGTFPGPGDTIGQSMATGTGNVLYVGDYVSGSISKYVTNGSSETLAATWPDKNPQSSGPPWNPVDVVAVDYNGDPEVWVLSKQDVIDDYSVTGTWLRESLEFDQSNSSNDVQPVDPTGFGVGGPDSEIFIADAQPPTGSGRIGVYTLYIDPTFGLELGWVRWINTEGAPVSVRGSAQGVWVLNSNGILQEFDPSGNALEQLGPNDVPGGWGPPGSDAQSGYYPSGLDVLSGVVYVTDPSNDRVLEFGPGGGVPASGGGPGTPLDNSCAGGGSSGGGYNLVGADGGMFSFGDAQFFGSEGGKPLNAPIVGMTTTPDRQGYWLVATDGGIFSFGDAQFYGSTGAIRLNKPIVGMASTPDGQGYWLVASDGGLFAFGDAQFYGSTGAIRLNKPIVGMASTPDGQGYWLVASDGGMFTFGDAQFFGSEGGKPLNAPIVGMASTPDGQGYWMVASDGGMFTFGDAQFLGSVGGQPLNAPIIAMASTPDGQGYRLVASDGGMFSFGDAQFFGSEGGKPLNAPIVGMANA